MFSSSTDTEIFPNSGQNRGSADAGHAVSVLSFGMTDQGAVRESNEDQFLIATLTKSLRIQQSSVPEPTIPCPADEGHIFLVADGFGGAPAGEQASALAVKSIECFLANSLKWFFRPKGPETEHVLAEFREALRQADAKLIEESAEHPQWDGMGTTLTLAYSLGATLFVAHAGDSRCYLFRDPELTQLTHDHTLAEALAARSVPMSDEKARRRFSHVITNALGGREQGVRPEIQKRALKPGDVLLLATDGLTRFVPDKAIAAVLGTELEPTTACKRLVAGALKAGGRDNVTVVVARYEAL